MIDLGFKLNATKTQKTEDIIEGSLKKDKLYRISHLEDLYKFCPNKGNLQKQIIRIYDFSKNFQIPVVYNHCLQNIIKI